MGRVKPMVKPKLRKALVFSILFVTLPAVLLIQVSFETVTIPPSEMSPVDNAITLDTTPDFNCTPISDTDSTVNVTLYVDNVASGTLPNHANNTVATITCNHTLTESDTKIEWYFNVTDTSGTTKSEVRNISIGPYFKVPAILLNPNATTEHWTYYLNESTSDYTVLKPIQIPDNNITLNGQYHTLDGDNSGAYGIYIWRVNYETTDIIVENITVTDWATHSVEVYKSHNVTLRNIWTGKTGSATGLGFHLAYSDYGTIYNVTVYNCAVGIEFATTHFWIVYNNTFEANTNCALWVEMTEDNFFYNNLLNSTTLVHFPNQASADKLNHWNIAKQSGTRIYSNGAEIGGNYYVGTSDTGVDVDHDGFLDSPIEFSATNIDYLPYSSKFGTGPYSLSMNSTPFSVPWTLNGLAQTTPFSRTLESGTYQINFASPFGGEATILDFYSEGNRSTYRMLRTKHPSTGTEASAISQAFVVPFDFNYNLTQVKFYLAKFGSPTGMAHAKLYETTGFCGISATPTGSALATSNDFNVSTLTTDYRLYTFTFSGANQYAMTKGSYYCIVFENPTSGTISVANYVKVGCDISSPSHKGNGAYFRYSTWYFTKRDYVFYVYGEPAVPEEGTWMFGYWDDDTNNEDTLRVINLQSDSSYSVTYKPLSYVFYGVFDEDSGLWKPLDERAVNVTAYFTEGANQETFEVNGTYTYYPTRIPQYFEFDLPSVTDVVSQYGLNHLVYNQSSYYDVSFSHYEEDLNYDGKVTLTWNSTYTISDESTTGFRVNFGTPPSEDRYLNWYVYRQQTEEAGKRQYWPSSGEAWQSIYIFGGPTTVYTITFVDLAGLLSKYPFVTANRYINGTYHIIEKRKADIEKKALMSLINGVKYDIVISDGASYTFGDLLMTPITTVTLTLKGLEFPERIILGYKYVRVYATRNMTSGTPVTIFYQDTLGQTNQVNIKIYFQTNDSVAWSDMRYTSIFIAYWHGSDNVTDYWCEVIVNHEKFGIMSYRQVLPRIFSSNPWDLSFLGILPFATNLLIPSFIVLCVFGVFSSLNIPVGLFAGVVTATILAYIGWLPIGPEVLILAWAFTIIAAIAYGKRRVYAT